MVLCLPADFACAMVELDGQVEPAVALSGQAHNIVHSHPIWGCGSRLSEQAFGRGTPGRVGVGGVRHDRVGLLLPQAVRVELAADAPAVSRVAVGLYFDLLLAGIVALVLVRKYLAHGHLLKRPDVGPVGGSATRNTLPAPRAAPGSAGARVPKRFAERFTGRCSRGRLSKDDQDFFKNMQFLRPPFIGLAQCAHSPVAGHF